MLVTTSVLSWVHVEGCWSCGNWPVWCLCFRAERRRQSWGVGGVNGPNWKQMSRCSDCGGWQTGIACSIRRLCCSGPRGVGFCLNTAAGQPWWKPWGEQNGLGSAISRSDRMAVGVGSRRSGVTGLLFQRGSSYRAFLTQRDSGSDVTFLRALLTLTFMFFKAGRILNYEQRSKRLHE